MPAFRYAMSTPPSSLSHAANAASTSLDSPASACDEDAADLVGDGRAPRVVDVDAADPRALGGEPLGGRAARCPTPRR